MKILSINQYRDCGTMGVTVQLDDGEVVEYLVHGHNRRNERFDVTRGGWKVQLTPTVQELKRLSAELWEYEYDPEIDYFKDKDLFMKILYVVNGMIDVYVHYLDNTKNYVPGAYVTEPMKDPMDLAVEGMANQLAQMMEEECMNALESRLRGV